MVDVGDGRLYGPSVTDDDFTTSSVVTTENRSIILKKTGELDEDVIFLQKIQCFKGTTPSLFLGLTLVRRGSYLLLMTEISVKIHVTVFSLIHLYLYGSVTL